MLEKLPLVNPIEPNNKPEEFAFHQERFNKMAEDYANRGFIRKLISPQDRSALDFARKEAYRDLADFDKKQSVEYKEWEKNLQPVIKNLLEKRDNMENKEIRPLLLVLGGGMKGPYSAGQALGLNEMGLNQVFDTAVGISAGAGTVSYFTAGLEQSRIGTSLFYENCTSKDFINFKRIHQIMNVQTIADAIKEGDKALDQEAVRKSRTEVYYGVTRASDGKSELINAKTATPSMTEALKASMALPIVYGESVEVNGEHYIDGAFDPMPVETLIEKFKPTDILVLPNIPFDNIENFELNFSEKLITKFVPRVGSLGAVEKFLRIKEEIRKSLEYIQSQTGVRIGIMWPPDSDLGNVTTDPTQIEAAIIESARSVIKQFGGEQPDKILLNHSGKKY